MRHRTPFRSAAIVGVTALIGLTACQSDPPARTSTGAPRLNAALVSFDSCAEAERELRAAAAASVGQNGFGSIRTTVVEDSAMEAQDPGAKAAAPAAPGDSAEFSGTNVQELGIDEPDIVKTDGERVIAVAKGTLYVIDAASASVTGRLNLGESAIHGSPTLLWHEDRVLVIHHVWTEIADTDDYYGGGATTLTLVDVSGGSPRAIDEYTIDGAHLDSRSRDGVVRVVVQSTPTITFEEPWFFEDDKDAAIDTVMDASIDEWLPDFRLNGEPGQVDCRALARPTDYSGTSTMTILTFDMTDRLDDGSPLTIAADGDTVYGTTEALYIANDRTFMVPLTEDKAADDTGTEIYRFAIDGPELRYHSDVTVDGYLLNRYAMSEWDGHLRVATTLRPVWNGDNSAPSSSSVHVLAIDDDAMTPVGRVDDLGIDERIYAVRYLGATAYVVTFRETDPLYVVDLSDPSAPVAVGELKIPGYSAYLHPIGDGRLIGVGQDADQSGRPLGTQVSLFDVSDPTDPRRVDVYTKPGSWAAVEYDPHAFLFWKGVLVLPVSTENGDGALRLTIDGDTITPLSTITHRGRDYGPIRALAIGDELWTMGDNGLLVGSLTGDGAGTWITFD